MGDNNKATPEVDKATGATLQSMADIKAATDAKAAEQASAARPVAAGDYVVVGTHVRSLDHLFKPGDAFTGAVGDIPGLLKSGALKLVGE